MDEMINITLEAVNEQENAHLKEEQTIEHLTNILTYLRYRNASVNEESMGVIIESVNTEGEDWFYIVRDPKVIDEDFEDPKMITYWCYDDEISGEKVSPEDAARGMWDFIKDYFNGEQPDKMKYYVCSIKDEDYGRVDCFYNPNTKLFMCGNDLAIMNTPEDWTEDIIQEAWSTYRRHSNTYGYMVVDYDQIPELEQILSQED